VKAPHYKPPPLDCPPVYTTAANPHLAAILDGRPGGALAAASAPPRQIAAAKGSPAYRAHTYHTKVPPEGIAPFIARYTRPGDVVLDPFCGSGMTGVAALRAGRRAVLVDLSPAATFIASNYCAQPNPSRLEREAQILLDAVRAELEPLYATACRSCGGPATIAYTVWSDRYACPDCGGEFLLWDVARQGRRVAGKLSCPHCRRQAARGGWQRLEPVPVLVVLDCAACGRQKAPPAEADLALAQAAAAGDWPSRTPYPTTPIPTRGDEIARVHKRGIRRVDQLFTRRNLRAIATLWHAAATLPGLECRSQLLFCITGAMPRASRTNKYIPALGCAPGPILGTMYIPGFHPEVNVLALFQRKVADAVRYYSTCQFRISDFGLRISDAVRISTQSATDLSNIPDRSIDYAFTDPPFGSNIAYSELNLLWESWLGARTHVPHEAIVSRTQGKSVDDYRRLMAQAFGEVRRVLKAGGRFSIVFHNTSADVWGAVQDAIADARLAVESVVTFDKGPNQSFKQFTAEGAVTHDLVVTCTSRAACRVPRAETRVASEADVVAFVRSATVVASSSSPRGTRHAARKLYSAAIARFLVEGKRMPLGFREFRALLGRM